MSIERVIWQYWETKGSKPLFVDDLHALAVKNAGVRVIQVTPDNLSEYVSNIPECLFEIKEMAHKADMIRTMLIHQNGGMWLDSDAIVLSDLNWIFDLLEHREFVCFNDGGNKGLDPLGVSINCFAAIKNSSILEKWISGQHEKFPKVEYKWSEVGADILNPILKKNLEKIELLDFSTICPITWRNVSKFSSWWTDSKEILESSKIVMLSNNSLHKRNKKITKMPICDLMNDETVIADILKKAYDINYQPKTVKEKIIIKLKSRLRAIYKW